MSDFGQGGGFGAPPGGQPPGGGGFGAPPAGGPGDGGPLAHIPFTPEDEANLSGMAKFAMFAGVAAIVAGLIQSIVQIIQAFAVGSATPGGVGGQVCGSIIGLGIAGLLALFLFKASTAVKKVVETDDADQENLVAALSALKAYFMVKGILAILVIVLFCCVVTGAMFMGAALASAFGNQ